MWGPWHIEYSVWRIVGCGGRGIRWCPSSIGFYQVLHLDNERALLLYHDMCEYDSSCSFLHLLGGINELVVTSNALFTAVGTSGVVNDVGGVWVCHCTAFSVWFFSKRLLIWLPLQTKLMALYFIM